MMVTDNLIHGKEKYESSLQGLGRKGKLRAGGNFKWPKREDKIYCAMEHVHKSLNHRIVVGNTGYLLKYEQD